MHDLTLLVPLGPEYVGSQGLHLAERCLPGCGLGSQGQSSSQSILDRSCRRTDNEHLVRMINAAGTRIGRFPASGQRLLQRKATEI